MRQSKLCSSRTLEVQCRRLGRTEGAVSSRSDQPVHGLPHPPGLSGRRSGAFTRARVVPNSRASKMPTDASTPPSRIHQQLAADGCPSVRSSRQLFRRVSGTGSSGRRRDVRHTVTAYRTPETCRSRGALALPTRRTRSGRYCPKSASAEPTKWIA